VFNHRTLTGRPEPEAAESAVVESVTSVALRQARQSDDPLLQREALSWLWVCCPDVAEAMGLPTPATHAPEADAIHDGSGYAARLEGAGAIFNAAA
jgi:hypothetical protein